MTHLAIPNGDASAAETQLASIILDSGTARRGSFAPLGFVLIASERRFTIVVIATTTFDADGWWTR